MIQQELLDCYEPLSGQKSQLKMSHSLSLSRLRGRFRGDREGRRNPFAVFRLGHKRSQTKALRVSLDALQIVSESKNIYS